MHLLHHEKNQFVHLQLHDLYLLSLSLSLTLSKPFLPTLRPLKTLLLRLKLILNYSFVIDSFGRPSAHNHLQTQFVIHPPNSFPNSFSPNSFLLLLYQTLKRTYPLTQTHIARWHIPFKRTESNHFNRFSIYNDDDIKNALDLFSPPGIPHAKN